MSSTRVVRVIRAPRARVYRALLDPAEVPRWLHPDGMRCEVHAFEPRVGGRFRISLTYEDPAFAGRGKSGGATDTFSGRFVELVPEQRVVETVEFESGEAAFRGGQRLIITLTDAPGGTELTWQHEGLPPGLKPEDNEAGTRMTLDRLASLVESSEAASVEAAEVDAEAAALQRLGAEAVDAALGGLASGLGADRSGSSTRRRCGAACAGAGRCRPAA
jgi:uncharacterized protein YndB with AHSA1/START domain